MPPVLLTISIATWNNRALVADCLRSIRKHPAGARTEIIVVDNASSDGTAAMIRAEFPEVRLLENEKPLGFSANHNQALRLASGRYIWLLNDDTVVLENTLPRALQFIESRPDAGAVGCTLLRPDGTLERISQRLPHPLDPLFPQLRDKTSRDELLTREPLEIERWSGAALLIRRQALEQVGFLDERFDPAYGEDTDLCHRIGQAGWRIYRLPNARVVHFRGRTAKREFRDQAFRLQRAKFFWYRKHRSRRQLWIYKAAVLLAALIEIPASLPLLLFGNQRARAADKLARSWQRMRAVL